MTLETEANPGLDLPDASPRIIDVPYATEWDLRVANEGTIHDRLTKTRHRLQDLEPSMIGS